MCSKKEILWVESRDLSQTDNSYYGVFFSKVEWWVVELLFLSLNNWGLNFLQNESSQFSQIYLSPEKLSKVCTFQSFKWLFAKLSKFTKMTTIFTKLLFWVKIGVILWICLALQVVISYSAWKKSCDSTLIYEQ